MANSQQLLLHHRAHVRVPRRPDHHSRRTGVGLHRTGRVLASWRWPHRLAALYRGRARCPHRAAIIIQRTFRLNVIMSHPSTAPTTAFQGHLNPKPPRPRIRHYFTFQPPPRGTKGTSQRRDKGIPNAAAPVQPLTLTGKEKNNPKTHHLRREPPNPAARVSRRMPHNE